MKSATRRAANMKHLWDMHMTEEYIQRKFSKGDGMCRCGKALETSTHVLHECSCEANSLGREQMTHKIHSSIRTLVATRAITPDWSWFLTRMFTLDESGKTEMWAPGTTPSWSLMAQGQRIPIETKKISCHGYAWEVNAYGRVFSQLTSQQPYVRWVCPRKLQINGVVTSANSYWMEQHQFGD
jgi:hypothetical protein